VGGRPPRRPARGVPRRRPAPGEHGPLHAAGRGRGRRHPGQPGRRRERAARPCPPGCCHSFALSP
jgi:hypothetical protein